jgi:hypothetical protein
VIALNRTVGTQFEWRQPEAFRRFHELMACGKTVASLRFEKGCGTLATATYGDARWTFKRTGFWSPRVTVRQAGSETDLAIFTPRWTGGGQLAFAAGRQFQLKSLSFWGGEWVFETADGSEAVSVRGPRGLMKHSGEASLGLSARSLPETPILLLLIWYLRLLMLEDAAATAGASVAFCG